MSESDYYYKEALNNIDKIEVSILMKIKDILFNKDLEKLLNILYETGVFVEKTFSYTNCMNDIHSKEINNKLNDVKHKIDKIFKDISKDYEIETTFH